MHPWFGTLICTLMCCGYAAIMFREKRRFSHAIENERRAMDKERDCIKRERACFEAYREHFASLPSIVRDGAPEGPTKPAWLFVADQLDAIRCEAEATHDINARGGSA